MRLRRLFSRRNVLLAAIVAAAQRLWSPTVAQADIWGGDVAVLTGILTQSVATVFQLISAIATLKQQLDAMNTMLSKLDSASFDDVLALINSTDFSYTQLTGDIAS